MARDREREVKIKKKSREFSRNENLAGLWTTQIQYNTLLNTSTTEFLVLRVVIMRAPERPEFKYKYTYQSTCIMFVTQLTIHYNTLLVTPHGYPLVHLDICKYIFGCSLYICINM